MKEIIVENKRFIEKRVKERKIDKYNLVNHVLNCIAAAKNWTTIAEELTRHMKLRKENPVSDFKISAVSVKGWWLENFKKFSDIVNERRNALITDRQFKFLDKTTKIREDVQEALENDAKSARLAAESSFDYEAAARIEEKIVKVQESGEKAILKQSPNLNLTQIIVNPVTKFSEKMKKKRADFEEDEANTIEIDFEDVDEE